MLGIVLPVLHCDVLDARYRVLFAVMHIFLLVLFNMLLQMCLLLQFAGRCALCLNAIICHFVQWPTCGYSGVIKW
jgi:hypothetical protein